MALSSCVNDLRTHVLLRTGSADKINQLSKVHLCFLEYFTIVLHLKAANNKLAVKDVSLHFSKNPFLRRNKSFTFSARINFGAGVFFCLYLAACKFLKALIKRIAYFNLIVFTTFYQSLKIQVQISGVSDRVTLSSSLHRIAS